MEALIYVISPYRPSKCRKRAKSSLDWNALIWVSYGFYGLIYASNGEYTVIAMYLKSLQAGICLNNGLGNTTVQDFSREIYVWSNSVSAQAIIESFPEIGNDIN